MTDPTYTDLTMILDRSGSMQSIKTDIEGGFDAFVAEQRSTPGRCVATLVQFDDRYEEVYVARDLAAVPPLALLPRGRTALLDAIGRAVADTGARLARMPEAERPGTVIIGIMTDGLENASRELTHAAVKSIIVEQESRYGWTFLYLGANQDAIEVGAGIGIAAERSLTYTPASADDAIHAYSASVTAIRMASAAGAAPAQAREAAAFTQDQRRKASR